MLPQRCCGSFMVKNATFGVPGLSFTFYLVGSRHFGMVRSWFFNIQLLCFVIYVNMNAWHCGARDGARNI